jgi:broad specificity phosphatase PhoE
MDEAASIHNAADVLLGAISSALSPEMKAQATRLADRLSLEVCSINGTLQMCL